MGTITKQQKNVPELRFSAFNDEWQKTTIKNLAARVGDGIHTTPVYSEDGEFFFVNGNNLDNGRITITESTKKLSTQEASRHHRELDTNTLLLSINGTVGNVAKYNNEQITLGKSACFVRLRKNKQVNFIYYLIQSRTVQRFYYSEVTGSTIKNLSLKSVANTPVFLPSSDEQQKVADFLGSVDSWLDNLRQQKTTLETYKRGMMQKLFTQQVRFKDDNGNDFPEWTTNDLGSVCRIRTGKKDVNQGNPNGKYPFFTCAKQHTYSDEYSFDCEAILIAGNGEVGHSLKYSGKFEAYQRTYVLSDFKLGYEYIWTVINTLFKDYVTNQTQKGAMPYIKLGTLQSFPVPLPTVQEQQKIAHFLTAIDETITAKANEITKVEQWKKGLMQKMFV